jgi:hypothetical protein
MEGGNVRPIRHTTLAALTLTALAVGVLTASPAGAVSPEIDRFTFSDVIDFPTGTICDFNLRFAPDFSIIAATYFDQQGDVVRVVDHVNGTDINTNLDTGLTLPTDKDHFTTTFDAQTETIAYRGLNLHVRAPNGKLAILAGRMTFDANTGELLSITPHMGGGFPVICRLLGGNPA